MGIQHKNKNIFNCDLLGTNFLDLIAVKVVSWSGINQLELCLSNILSNND